ncbi:MAG: hypothetical protein BalsKO_01940 [Balneolaceae bacterium]
MDSNKLQKTHELTDGARLLSTSSIRVCQLEMVVIFLTKKYIIYILNSRDLSSKTRG